MSLDVGRVCAFMRAHLDGPSNAFFVTPPFWRNGVEWQRDGILRVFGGFLQPDMIPLDAVDAPRIVAIIVPVFNGSEWCVVWIPLETELYVNRVLRVHCYNFSVAPDLGLAERVAHALKTMDVISEHIEIEPLLHDAAGNVTDAFSRGSHSRTHISLVMSFCVMAKLAAAVRTMGIDQHNLSQDDMSLFMASVASNFPAHSAYAMAILNQPPLQNSILRSISISASSLTSYAQLLSASSTEMAHIMEDVCQGALGSSVVLLRHLLYRWSFSALNTGLFYTPRLREEMHLVDSSRGNRAIMCGTPTSGFVVLVCYQRCWFMYRAGAQRSGSDVLYEMSVDVDTSRFVVDLPPDTAYAVTVSLLVALRVCWWFALTSAPPPSTKLQAWTADAARMPVHYMQELNTYVCRMMNVEYNCAQRLRLSMIVDPDLLSNYTQHGVHTLSDICSNRTTTSNIDAYVSISRILSSEFEQWLAGTGGYAQNGNSNDPMVNFLSQWFGTAFSQFSFLVHSIPPNLISSDIGFSMPYAPYMSTHDTLFSLEVTLSFVALLNHKLRFYSVISRGDSDNSHRVREGAEGVVILAQRDVCESMRETAGAGHFSRQLKLDYVTVDPGRGGWSLLMQCKSESTIFNATPHWMHMPFTYERLLRDKWLRLYTMNNPLQWTTQMHEVLTRIDNVKRTEEGSEARSVQLCGIVRDIAHVPITEMYDPNSETPYHKHYICDPHGRIPVLEDMLLQIIKCPDIDALYRFGIHTFGIALYDQTTGMRVLRFPDSFTPLLFLGTALAVIAKYNDTHAVERVCDSAIPINVLNAVFVEGDVGEVIEHVTYDLAYGTACLELRTCDPDFEKLLHVYLYNINNMCMSDFRHNPADLDDLRSRLCEGSQAMIASYLHSNPHCARAMWNFVMTLGI